MAWTAPRTWVAGETVTAAMLNAHLRDNLKAITDPWTSYTPTLVSGWSGGSPTLAGRYLRAGSTIHVWASLTCSSGMTLTTSPTVTLPFSAKSGSVRSLDALLIDNGTGVYPGWAHINGGNNQCQIYAAGSTPSYWNVTATYPFTWVPSDSITWFGTYETDAA